MRASRPRTAVSVAEIVSALAVVVALLHAVSEPKRSRALASTDIETIPYARMLEMDRLVAETGDLAPILVRAREEPEGQGAGKRARVLAYEHIFHVASEAAVAARAADPTSEAAFESWDGWFAEDAARRPRLGWSGDLRNHGPEFIDSVESRVTWE